MMEWLQWLFANHRFKVLGPAIGLVFALLVIHYGPGWALFIVLCTGVGYYLGRKLDEEPEGLTEMLERVIPSGSRKVK